jgi:VWFA-related protein
VHVKFKVAAMVAVSGLWLASDIVGARQVAPSFRSGVNQVALNVVVKDNRGRPVRDLAGSDFQVFDHGRAVAINDFRTGEEAVSLAILVDTSGSMILGERLATARQALDLLLAQFRAEDEAALFVFDKRLREIVPFSKDIVGLLNGFARVDPYGATALHDAVAAAAGRLTDRPSVRRAVIAITDGFDTGSELSATAASGVASLSDVPVYVLAVANTALPADARAGAPVALEPMEGGGVARLDELTARTGGASFSASATDEATRSVRQILTDLRSGYLLGFTPHDRSGWHELSVRVSRKDARVRARAGFWIAPPTSSSR